MTVTKERIPVGVENNPVIRSLVEERSTLETLLVRNISLLQIEGRFVNGNPDIKKPILIVSTILSPDVVEQPLQELIARNKRAKRPFGEVAIVHPREFQELVDRYS